MNIDFFKYDVFERRWKLKGFYFFNNLCTKIFLWKYFLNIKLISS